MQNNPPRGLPWRVMRAAIAAHLRSIAELRLCLLTFGCWLTLWLGALLAMVAAAFPELSVNIKDAKAEKRNQYEIWDVMIHDESPVPPGSSWRVVVILQNCVLDFEAKSICLL